MSEMGVSHFNDNDVDKVESQKEVAQAPMREATEQKEQSSGEATTNFHSGNIKHPDKLKFEKVEGRSSYEDDANRRKEKARRRMGKLVVRDKRERRRKSIIREYLDRLSRILFSYFGNERKFLLPLIISTLILGGYSARLLINEYIYPDRANSYLEQQNTSYIEDFNKSSDKNSEIVNAFLYGDGGIEAAKTAYEAEIASSDGFYKQSISGYYASFLVSYANDFETAQKIMNAVEPLAQESNKTLSSYYMAYAVVCDEAGNQELAQQYRELALELEEDK